MRDLAPVFKGYRIYPRGFLGAALGIQPKPIVKPHEARVRTHQFNPAMFQAPRVDVEVNHNVEEIWSRMLRHSYSTLDFNFREKVLIVALGAFGTTDFRQWVYTQFEGPSTGELHAEFVEDTLKFILTGKRKMTVTNWESLLTLSDITTNVTAHSKQINEFFTNPDTKQTINLKLTDVLIRWCSHEGGFEDLVQTLHVLFGDIVN
jgi:hypothetical protein